MRNWCLPLVLCLAGCAGQQAAGARWCMTEPSGREGRAASRVTVASAQLDWADSCVDLFGRYAARNQLRVVVSYTPPRAAGAEDATRVASLRAVIANAAFPADLYDLRVQKPGAIKSLADDEGLIVIDLAERS